MVTPRAWLLNLDADEELARPAGYTPSASVSARLRPLAERIGPLLGPDDHLLWPDGARHRLVSALPGRAWCPTPRALRLLREAGATPPPAPPLDVLRRVNHRRFCAELGQMLPGACFATTVDEVAQAVALPSPTALWLLKRSFGFAGRGRLRIPTGPIDAPTRAWVIASLERHGQGLQVEPWVDRCGDFSQHGHLTAAGELVVGVACLQRCDERGTWLSTERASPGDLAPAEATALHQALHDTGQALAAAGYFGPFGIDAFRWRDGDQHFHFNPRCEINARYTMGWATGMSPRRPDLDLP
ncbi:hypothetical protein [Chondromyces crocatus]|uniref:ATP-grasp domain-containing protein n=1 Tax=Chondromyces crocatus TaxID=52 RepID=A0A0K1EAK9_CHOCO|nr:hypothetical protein [Chondromyces crocatus]AKT37921.1 uncharacterized protein CMC5_020640 [Chondromyces crocatus]